MNTEEFEFRVNKLPPYLLGSIASSVLKARLSGREIIDLSTVNPDGEPPPEAVEGLIQASLLPYNHRYSASKGIAKLRAGIASWYDKLYGVKLDPDLEVVSTMGSKEALVHLLMAVLNPGDNVVLPTPAYPIHKTAVSLAGGSALGIPLVTDNCFKSVLDHEQEEDFFRRLEKRVQATWPRPRLMIVSFPHNPTSMTVKPGFYEQLVSFAKKYSMFVVNDFAYAELYFDDQPTSSILQAEDARDVAVELYSLSKSLSMAGWRIGFCVGQPELVGALTKIKSYIDFGAFQPLQIGAVKALTNPEANFAEKRAIYQMRRDVLVSGLENLGWEFVKPQASVFVWARLPEPLKSMGSLRACEVLLKEASVALCPGVGFDENCDEFVRIALVEPENRIQEAILNIKSFFLSLK